MSKDIVLAREIFKKAFEEDQNFRDLYVSNIAMLLYDKYGLINYKDRNNAANDIMAVIFDAKEFKKKKVGNNKKVSRFEIMDI